MKVGDLVKHRYYLKHTLGVVVDADEGNSYIGILWTHHTDKYNCKGVTYHHIFDLAPLDEDKKCPGEEHHIDYIIDTPKED